MPLDATLTNEGTCEMETTAQQDSSRLPTKMDSNVEKYCRHNGNGGKGVCDSFFIYVMGTDLIFFYGHRPEGLITL